LTKITINPRFRWSDKLDRFILVSHDGQYESEVAMRFDRGAASDASQMRKTSGQQADIYGERGTEERGAIVPGLEREAQNPTGFTPLEKSSIQTSTGEALGGVNAGAAGEARLNAMRTRNASGFAPALAEAARSTGRAAAANAQQLNIADAELARQRQDAARSALMRLYGIDTGQQLGEQKTQVEDLQAQLAAGRQGWLQNTLDTINTLANARKAFKG